MPKNTHRWHITALYQRSDSKFSRMQQSKHSSTSQSLRGSSSTYMDLWPIWPNLKMTHSTHWPVTHQPIACSGDGCKTVIDGVADFTVFHSTDYRRPWTAAAPVHDTQGPPGGVIVLSRHVEQMGTWCKWCLSLSKASFSCGV